MKLGETAKQFKKRAVIFMDEFQHISTLEHFHSIEAAIRHRAKGNEHIAYVFSDSNRQLLKHVFGDQTRPLYKLCHLLTLNRMSKEVSIEHLQLLAKTKWKKHLSVATESIGNEGSGLPRRR